MTGPSGRREPARVAWALRPDWLMIKAWESCIAAWRHTRQVRSPYATARRFPKGRARSVVAGARPLGKARTDQALLVSGADLADGFWR